MRERRGVKRQKRVKRAQDGCEIYRLQLFRYRRAPLVALNRYLRSRAVMQSFSRAVMHRFERLGKVDGPTVERNYRAMENLRGLGRTRQLTESWANGSHECRNVAHADGRGEEHKYAERSSSVSSAGVRHVRTPVGVGVGADMTCEDFASTIMPMADGSGD